MYVAGSGSVGGMSCPTKALNRMPVTIAVNAIVPVTAMVIGLVGEMCGRRGMNDGTEMLGNRM